MLCRALCVLLFLAWTAEAASDTVIYCGLWRSPFEVFAPLFASIPGISLFPWQVLLLALTPLCLLKPGAFRQRPLAMDAAIGASLASVALTFLWGFARGGSAYNAYYQLWRFLLALLVCLLLLSVVRRPRDLRAVGLTVLLAALVRGTLVVYFYWAHVHGKIYPPPIYMTTHDDTLLFVAGLLVMLSWALARMKRNHVARHGPRLPLPALRHHVEQPPPRLDRARDWPWHSSTSCFHVGERDGG